MSGYVKAGASFLKNLLKGASKPKTTKAINFVKPSVHKTAGAQKLAETYINIGKERGKMKKSFQKMEDDIDPARKKLRNTLQKMSNEPVTESGITKGKNIVEKKAKGGRIGLKRGTNLQKIQKAFSSQSPMSRMTGKKKKKGFPDISGDGKITKKDVLMARGVIPKPKKKVI
jgi:hypothetical protein|tara:strand:+ start:36 stop:551 length:516 start_codon:yes stop_codon:yes gene_type:complete